MAVILRNPLTFGIVLLISLALNLLLGGAVIGWLVQRADPTNLPFPKEWWQLPNHLPAILHVLPDAHERIDPILRRNAPIVHPKVRQMQLAKHEVYRQIGIDPLDINALTKAFTRLRQVEFETKTVIHQVVIEVISSLTPEERQQLQSRLSNREGREAGHIHFPPGEPPFLSLFSPKADKLKKRDQNGDGKLSHEEFLAPVPQQKQARANHHFQMLDVDKDGFINQSEIESASSALPPTIE